MGRPAGSRGGSWGGRQDPETALGEACGFAWIGVGRRFGPGMTRQPGQHGKILRVRGIRGRIRGAGARLAGQSLHSAWLRENPERATLSQHLAFRGFCQIGQASDVVLGRRGGAFRSPPTLDLGFPSSYARSAKGRSRVRFGTRRKAAIGCALLVAVRNRAALAEASTQSRVGLLHALDKNVLILYLIPEIIDNVCI